MRLRLTCASLLVQTSVVTALGGATNVSGQLATSLERPEKIPPPMPMAGLVVII